MLLGVARFFDLPVPARVFDGVMRELGIDRPETARHHLSSLALLEERGNERLLALNSLVAGKIPPLSKADNATLQPIALKILHAARGDEDAAQIEIERVLDGSTITNNSAPIVAYPNTSPSSLFSDPAKTGLAQRHVDIARSINTNQEQRYEIYYGSQILKKFNEFESGYVARNGIIPEELLQLGALKSEVLKIFKDLLSKSNDE